MRPRHKPGCTAFFHTPASGCPCFGLQTRPGWRPVVACRQSVGGFGFRLSPFPDGFRLRFAFGWLFSGGALPAAATARSALLRLCRFIPICCCTRPKDLMKKITLIMHKSHQPFPKHILIHDFRHFLRKNLDVRIELFHRVAALRHRSSLRIVDQRVFAPAPMRFSSH